MIDSEWDRAGISPDQDSTLARLHRLTHLRIDARLLEGVSVTEARTLSTEARAVGDEELAADLEARARERLPLSEQKGARQSESFPVPLRRHGGTLPR